MVGRPGRTQVQAPQHHQPPPCFARGTHSGSSTKPSSSCLLSLTQLQAGGWGWRRRSGSHLDLASTQAWSITPPTNLCPWPALSCISHHTTNQPVPLTSSVMHFPSRYQPTRALDQLSHVSPHPSPASLMTQTQDPSFPTSPKHLPFTTLAHANCTEMPCCFTRRRPWSFKFSCSGSERGQKRKVLVVSSSPQTPGPVDSRCWISQCQNLPARKPTEACRSCQRCCVAE